MDQQPSLRLQTPLAHLQGPFDQPVTPKPATTTSNPEGNALSQQQYAEMMNFLNERNEVLTVSEIQYLCRDYQAVFPQMQSVIEKDYVIDLSDALENFPQDAASPTYFCPHKIINVPSLEVLNNCSQAWSVAFAANFNELIRIQLSPNITHLKFNRFFNQEVNFKNLPTSLTNLSFTNIFNFPIDELLVSLTHLSINGLFNQKIDHLPLNLVSLSFGIGDYAIFNPIDHLPSKLRTLTIEGDLFNQTIDQLPQSLTHLSIKGAFNQKIKKLPLRLTHLSLEGAFDQKVKQLPQSLTHLSIKDSFSQKVNHLPPFLTNLTLVGKFNLPVNKLPRSLLTLTLGQSYNSTFLPNTLPNLEYLNIQNVTYEYTAALSASRRDFFPKVKNIIIGGHQVYVLQ